MNVRAREEHTYTTYSSHLTRSKGAGVYTCGSCASGHSDCVLIRLDEILYFYDITVKYTNKNTSRAVPINIRSKAHIHNYKQLDIYIESARRIGNFLNCPSGHNACRKIISGTPLLPESGMSVSSSDAQVNYTPSLPIEMRRKHKHTHTLENGTITTKSGIVSDTVGCPSCPSGHGYCTATTTTIHAPEVSNVSTLEGYE